MENSKIGKTKMLNKIYLVLLLICLSISGSYAQETEEVIFSGTPTVKISEGGASRIIEERMGVGKNKKTIISNQTIGVEI